MPSVSNYFSAADELTLPAVLPTPTPPFIILKSTCPFSGQTVCMTDSEVGINLEEFTALLAQFARACGYLPKGDLMWDGDER